jgi:hypothetical protein
MSAATLPLTDDIVTFRNQIGCAPEVQIRKRIAEVGHERLDIDMTATRLVKRVL